jgi:MFS family permease
MWELYAFWTWIPAFLAASVTAAAQRVDASFVSLAAFSVIAAGGAGCLWGGWLADRIGYDRLVIRALVASGVCSLLAAAVFGGPLWLLLPLALTWGFFVVADSAQFSAMVTEVVPQHAVGTALTLQTSLGFLLTMLTIQLVPAVADAGSWRWAFVGLALGPAAGIWSIRRLQRAGRTWRRSDRTAGQVAA